MECRGPKLIEILPERTEGVRVDGVYAPGARRRAGDEARILEDAQVL